jgi:DNA-binding MarR family transcriptional regulator
MQEIEALRRLTDEVRTTFHFLADLVEVLHDGVLSPGERAVLEFVHRHGPTTVPDIARARGVTRQHIQTLVNDLHVRALVETRDNPAHRRSRLVALTPSGRAAIEVALRREVARIAHAGDVVSITDMDHAATTLAALRGALTDHGSTP